MPTSAQVTFSLNEIKPVDTVLSRTQAVAFGASQTLQAGTLVAQKTSDQKFYAYQSGASDGTQNPVGVVQYDCSTDSSGNAYLSLTPGATEWGQVEQSLPMYFTGVFNLGSIWNYNSGTPIQATATDINKIAGGKTVILGSTAANTVVQF